jgi:hypothetical protein
MPRNPADRVLRSRVFEPLHFPDLTERLTLRLDAVQRYLGKSHFAAWHRVLGSPDFTNLTGVFSPLVHVELEVDEAAPTLFNARLSVRGETYLARTVDEAGALRHLVREGRHEVRVPDGPRLAIARLVNAFTRYDPDPAKRRVTELPAEWGLGPLPSRVIDVPALEDIVPSDRPPDLVDAAPHVWHFGQTDENRHVNGNEYLRSMESWLADAVFAAGHDLGRLWAAHARIVYRKPCFRGEGYRRVAWFRGEAPLVIAGAFVKVNDPPTAKPAAMVELTYRQHPAPDA